jgi:hypothetical protein
LSTPKYSRYQIHATRVVDLRQEKSVAKSRRISLTQTLNVAIIEGYRISHMLSYNENDRNDAGYPGGDFGQGGKAMRFYSGQHQYYCGIDLHTRHMSVGIVNQADEILYHRNCPVSREALLEKRAPYREDVVVCIEWVCRQFDVIFACN